MAPTITAPAPKPNAIVPRLASQPAARAYVTFLAGNGDYVDGVVGLVKGLRKVKSKYQLVVAVLPEVPEDHCKILEEQGCIVRKIEPVHPPENQTQLAMGYHVINYSKLRIWEFEQYSKMIYLDGDIQVYRNIDHLFDLPDGLFYAVKDCFCEKTWSHTPQYKIGYCQQCPDRVQWPEAELGPCPAPYFNAGMFVFEPSLTTSHNLLEALKVTPPMPFAEQDFLNMYFRDTYSPISPFYNLVPAMLWRHPENIELDKVKVAHYCTSGCERGRYTRMQENIDPKYMKTQMEKWFEKVNVVRYCTAGSKPWRYTGKEENMGRDDIKMLMMKWWDIYDNKSLDYCHCAAPVVEAEPVNLQPFLEASAGGYNTGPSAA